MRKYTWSRYTGSQKFRKLHEAGKFAVLPAVARRGKSSIYPLAADKATQITIEAGDGKESYLVDQIMLIGEDRKMVTALIAPDFENLKDWCQKKDVECDWTDREKVLENDTIQSRYEKMVREKNQELDHVEQVKTFRLVPDEWSVESGELTPTMKVKREVIEDQYRDLIESMYV